MLMLLAYVNNVEFYWLFMQTSRAPKNWMPWHDQSIGSYAWTVFNRYVRLMSLYHLLLLSPWVMSCKPAVQRNTTLRSGAVITWT